MRLKLSSSFPLVSQLLNSFPSSLNASDPSFKRATTVISFTRVPNTLIAVERESKQLFSGATNVFFFLFYDTFVTRTCLDVGSYVLFRIPRLEI